jgi:hypothetical protein
MLVDADLNEIVKGPAACSKGSMFASKRSALFQQSRLSTRPSMHFRR